MLYFKNISLKFSDHTILSSIHLTISQGEMLVILGSNGSGKSSLLKLIDRRYSASAGEILFQGKQIENYSATYLANNIVTLSQNSLESLFPHLTVEENFHLAKMRAHVKELSVNYLATFNSKLLQHKKNLAVNLSGGEQQALVLALACLTKPKILLLDEHTSALDPHTAEKLMQLTVAKAKEQGITCLLTTHNLELAHRYGTRLIALQAGRIIRDFSYPGKNEVIYREYKTRMLFRNDGMINFAR